VAGVGDTDTDHHHPARGAAQCARQFVGLPQAQIVGTHRRDDLVEFGERTLPHRSDRQSHRGVHQNRQQAAVPGVEDGGRLSRADHDPDTVGIGGRDVPDHSRAYPVVAAMDVADANEGNTVHRRVTVTVRKCVAQEIQGS
jgi:hypothetical protein